MVRSDTAWGVPLCDPGSSGITCCRRVRVWQKAGVWVGPHRVLGSLHGAEQPGQRVPTRGEAAPSSVRTRRIADRIEPEPSPSSGALGHAAGGAPEPWQSQPPSRASRDTPTKSCTTHRSAGSSGGNSTGSMPTNLSVALDAEASRRHFQTAPKRTARRLDPVIGNGWELGRKVRLHDIGGSNAGSRKLRSAWGFG